MWSAGTLVRTKAATAREKAATESSGASGGLSGGTSGGLDGRVSTVSDEEVMHQLRPAGTPGGFLAWTARAAAERSSPGGEEALPEKMSPLVGAAQAVAAKNSHEW